jgi:hypothetical protein
MIGKSDVRVTAFEYYLNFKSIVAPFGNLISSLWKFRHGNPPHVKMNLLNRPMDKQLFIRSNSTIGKNDAVIMFC